MSTNLPEFKSDPAVVAMIPAVERVRQFTAGLVIQSASIYEEAATLLKSIKAQITWFDDARIKITKPINDGLREINAQHKATVAPLLEAERAIKAAMLKYSDEEDRIREEEQRKANETAAKERARLQAIADEAARKAAEEAAAKRKASQDAAAAGRAEEAIKLAAQADRVEEKAQSKVEAFESRAAAVVAPISHSDVPKVGGIRIPLVWDFEIVDAALIPREFLDVNETRIRKVVKAMQAHTNIPGVKVKQVKQIAAGSS